MEKANLTERESFITADGSAIRELAHPAWTAAQNQSLADRDETQVTAGDCVVIPPGTPHKLWNTGTEPLTLLCCCAPAYSDADTVMTGG